MNGYTLTSSFNGALGESPISQILNIDANTNIVISSPNEIQFSNMNNFNTKIDNSGILRVWYNSNISGLVLKIV